MGPHTGPSPHHPGPGGRVHGEPATVGRGDHPPDQHHDAGVQHEAGAGACGVEASAVGDGRGADGVREAGGDGAPLWGDLSGGGCGRVGGDVRYGWKVDKLCRTLMSIE